MRELILITESFFRDRGMRINAQKCFSLRLSTTVKDRAPVVIKEPTYKINGDNLASTSYSGTFKYLGIKFNPNDKTSMNTKDLQDILEHSKKAPLKPFQKLDILRSNVIRKLFHHLVLGKITKGLLIKLDDNVRLLLRSISTFHTTPTSFVLLF